mmetsp:Transcript_24997/g.48895  ORF Transcript_24997/g.48895 Transcript_24997/m.48895 type:complete len:93 (+) Transcript_24997:1-279(+)
MEKFHISAQLGDALGTWAASVVFAAFTGPVNFFLLPTLAPMLSQNAVVKALRDSQDQAPAAGGGSDEFERHRKESSSRRDGKRRRKDENSEL